MFYRNMVIKMLKCKNENLVMYFFDISFVPCRKICKMHSSTKAIAQLPLKIKSGKIISFD